MKIEATESCSMTVDSRLLVESPATRSGYRVGVYCQVSGQWPVSACESREQTGLDLRCRLLLRSPNDATHRKDLPYFSH